MKAGDLRFEEHGAQYFPSALTRSGLDSLIRALSSTPENLAGVRLAGDIARPLEPFLSADGAVGVIAARLLGPEAIPVRAVLFDKTSSNNWRLGWHQDRTIAVKVRSETPGYGPWSVKSGLQHVTPPFRVLAGMATLRVHLDAVDADNAPLQVALGSHRLGAVAEPDLDTVVSATAPTSCLAEAGDVWAYATPILHASDASRRPRRRRVLQVDYAARSLDGELEWLGV